MNEVDVVFSQEFELSFDQISKSLSVTQREKLGYAIESLISTLSIFPEMYPYLFPLQVSENPFRKAVVDRKYIVIYIYQFEKVILIDMYHSSQNWQNLIAN